MTIGEWITSAQDYETGKELYNSFGNNLSLKQFFSRQKEGDAHGFQREKLVYELRKLDWGLGEPMINDQLPITNEKPSESIFAGTPLPIKMTKEQLETHFAPMSISQLLGAVQHPFESLTDYKNRLFAEGSALHQGLEYEKDEAKRYEIAERILEIFDTELPRLWAKLDYIKETGQMPVAEIADDPGSGPGRNDGLENLSPVELMKKLGNIRAQISKFKKNDAKADKLKEAEGLRDEIEKLLKSK